MVATARKRPTRCQIEVMAANIAPSRKKNIACSQGGSTVRSASMSDVSHHCVYRALIAAQDLPSRPDPAGASAAEDGFPDCHVLGVHPAFDLLPAAVVEHARHPDLDVQARPPGTHVAECADVLVVPEHIVLPDREPERSDPSDPGDARRGRGCLLPTRARRARATRHPHR
jgi:hypothetical protein